MRVAATPIRDERGGRVRGQPPRRHIRALSPRAAAAPWSCGSTACRARQPPPAARARPRPPTLVRSAAAARRRARSRRWYAGATQTPRRRVAHSARRAPAQARARADEPLERLAQAPAAPHHRRRRPRRPRARQRARRARRAHARRPCRRRGDCARGRARARFDREGRVVVSYRWAGRPFGTGRPRARVPARRRVGPRKTCARALGAPAPRRAEDAGARCTPGSVSPRRRRACSGARARARASGRGGRKQRVEFSGGRRAEGRPARPGRRLGLAERPMPRTARPGPSERVAAERSRCRAANATADVRGPARAPDAPGGGACVPALTRAQATAPARARDADARAHRRRPASTSGSRSDDASSTTSERSVVVVSTPRHGAGCRARSARSQTARRERRGLPR